VGLKNTSTGDTLCPKEDPIVLESMQFPPTVISMSIRPTSRADRDKLTDALAKLAKEDPTFKRFTDPETGETIIAGMGELHLDIIKSRLVNEYGVHSEVGKPKVAYRQTFRKACDVEGKHVKQTGGRGQFGVVWVRFGISDQAELEWIDGVTGGSVPREYIPAVRKGIAAACERGGATGFPFVQVRAELFDGKAHSVDSSEMAFQEAGRLAFDDAVNKVGVTVLEPIMRITVLMPSTHVGDVIGSLNSRRALIEAIDEARGSFSQVRGRVPLAEMFNYATTLRSMTAGRGTYSMEPAEYAPVPESIAEEVLREARERKATGLSRGGRGGPRAPGWKPAADC
jgi:elongation factor G